MVIRRFIIRPAIHAVKTAIILSAVTWLGYSVAPSLVRPVVDSLFSSASTSIGSLTEPFIHPERAVHRTLDSVPTYGQPLEVSVLSIQDGDTVTVSHNGKKIRVRLAGIDAPESGQLYGTESAAVLAQLLHKKRVTMTIKEHDRFGRAVAWLMTPDGSVNAAMIDAGAAWHFAQYDQTPALAAAMRDARSARRGLWAYSSPVPPWEYRAAAKN
jgi:endonuclease YncB( thermonuclease family)